MSSQTILELRACGTLADDTRVAAEGTDDWLPLGEALSALKAVNPPARGAETSAKLVSTGKAAGEKAIDHARVFAHRILRSNFIDDQVTELEREHLEEAGVKSPMAQSYLGWRRALLWFSAGLLVVSLLAGLKENLSLLEDGYPFLLRLLLLAAVAAPVVACVFLFKAALDWTKVKRTRSLARLSWFFLFVVPIVLAMIPAAKLMGSDHFTSYAEMQMFGATWGAIMVLTIAPSLLGLFPAIIRSSLTIKTLVPESPMPGWVAAIVAPFYALFFLMILVIAIQVDQFLLSVSMLCFTLAPVFILINAGRLVQPSPEAEAMRTVLEVRRKTVITLGIGMIAGLVWFLGKMEALDLEFLSVVTSDFLVGMFKAAYDRECLMREEGMADTLGQRFADLDTLGLTELRAGEAELLNRIRGRGKGGA